MKSLFDKYNFMRSMLSSLFSIFSILAIALTVLTLQIHSVKAENLGTYGVVYPILETDLLDFIRSQLSAWKESGKLQQEEEKIQQKIKYTVRHPKPVAFLTTTHNPREYNYVPIFKLTHDIRDAQGKILLPQGKTVNALDTMILHDTLLFFNADDQRQVEWAVLEGKKHDSVKYILTGGDIFLTSKKLGRIYFDQEGVISKKLELEHIPCAVYQVKNHLHIQEFNIEALS